MKGPFVVLIFLGLTGSTPLEKILYRHLMFEYNKLARPIRNHSKAIDIHFKFKLTKLVDVVEKRQTLIVSGFLLQMWHDYRLQWDTKIYPVDVLHIPAQFLWLPDIILYNNADGSPQVTKYTKAHIYPNGMVFWEPPVIYQSMCQMDIQYFPFDEQECKLKFGSWTYTSQEVNVLPLDLENQSINSYNTSDHTIPKETEMYLDDYETNEEWDIMEAVGVRNFIVYPCCPLAYIDITYFLVIRRKTLFHTLNFILPCVMLTSLCSFVFYLPIQSHNKINLCVSVLVSLNVFLLVLTEIIPPTSLVVPLLGRYLVFTMIVVTLSLICSVFVSNLSHQCGPLVAPPEWAKRLFIRWLPQTILLRTSAQALRHERARRLSHTQTPEEHLNQVPRLLLYPTAKPLLRAVYNANACLQYIREHFRQRQLEQILRDEWLFMAMAVDRILLIIFTFTTVVASSVILLSAPTLWDGKQPMVINNTNDWA